MQKKPKRFLFAFLGHWTMSFYFATLIDSINLWLPQSNIWLVKILWEQIFQFMLALWNNILNISTFTSLPCCIVKSWPNLWISSYCYVLSWFGNISHSHNAFHHWDYLAIFHWDHCQHQPKAAGISLPFINKKASAL